MLKLKKFFVCFVLVLLLISTSVFANDVLPMSNNQENSNTVITNTPPSANSNTNNNSSTNSQAPQTANEDLYIYNTDSYMLTNIINGNVFASTNKFVTNSKDNGGIINGNLYVISSEVTISSDVTYANSKDKNGYDIVNSINSKSVINGNVYILADTFTLEAGSEIHGDLYVAANNVNIEQNAIIDGNLFVTASTINLNGQVSDSAYIAVENFTMTYFTYVSRDLFLNCTNATLAGIIHRNAFLTVDENLITESDFKVSEDLNVNFAKDFSFSGQVEGDAKINAKKLAFKTGDEINCIILGNLTYGTESNTEVPKEIVKGQISTAEYVDITKNTNYFYSALISLVSLLIFVFAIVLLSRFFTPNAVAKLPSIDIKNTLISLAIGFVSIFILIALIMILLFTGVCIPVALFLILGYMLVACIALPIFLYNIADVIKLKLNIYIKLLIVTTVFFLISLIPVLGPIVVFVSLFIGIGRILFTLSIRKK